MERCWFLGSPKECPDFKISPKIKKSKTGEIKLREAHAVIERLSWKLARQEERFAATVARMRAANLALRIQLDPDNEALQALAFPPPGS